MSSLYGTDYPEPFDSGPEDNPAIDPEGIETLVREQLRMMRARAEARRRLAAMPATLTVPQAGSLLGIGRDAAYRAAADGTIPTLRLGRRLVVPTAKLAALLGIPLNNSEAGPASPAVATLCECPQESTHDDIRPC